MCPPQKHSTAAMDMEPLPSATKRIRPIADKRLGSRDEPKHLPDAGHRVYVDNLHPKVTQEDIFVSSFPLDRFIPPFFPC